MRSYAWASKSAAARPSQLSAYLAQLIFHSFVSSYLFGLAPPLEIPLTFKLFQLLTRIVDESMESIFLHEHMFVPRAPFCFKCSALQAQLVCLCFQQVPLP
mgnify:CR=1 FL=1